MSEAEEKNDKQPDGEEAIPTASYGAGAVGPGGQVGPYKLLSVLGEGGYGIVYLAERQRPVKRRVALKVIKPGMDTKQVIARFEAERQALALLEHPNIAHVFNAGTTEAGRPYFVMEYVKGVPITEHCDRHKLTIEERLNLFLRVCEAIQHAHQKGIIHRDIKPSNIQVAIQGEQVVPKVIDFGVAKAISQSLTERTLVTEQGQFVGTPEYMSPEQAEMTGQDVDTRTDIYSLSVVLYELLTGVLPFEAKTLREGGVDHIRQVIREEDPKTPSTRLSTISGEESMEVARLRRTDIRTLGRKLHGDLDWITIRAMEKDRTRRYASAGELAADVRRHLNHEPVVAGPPSTVYKIKKFVRRNRASVMTAGVVGAAILVGFIVSTTMYFKAEGLRVEAEQAGEKEATARVQAEQAEKTAQQQRQRAERLLASAQLERGVKLLNEGNRLGLLDLLDARITADKIPELRDSAGRLWAIAYSIWSDRLVHVMPRAHALEFSPDGELLATASETTAQIWHTATGRPYSPTLLLGKNIDAIVFSPDGTILATHSVEGAARLWSTATGKPIGPILSHEDATARLHPTAGTRWSAAFSPDGNLLATAGLDRTVRLWGTDTGLPYGQPLRHEGVVGAVAFSPDGKLLVSGSEGGPTRFWDVVTGKPHGLPLQHKGYLGKVAFSPDGKLVATLSGDVELWETESGKLRLRDKRRWWLKDIAFSPDGKLLAVASVDWTARLWDTTTGEAHGEPMRHEGRVWSVAFSPDGNVLATASLDQTVRFWDVATGQPHGQPLHHQYPVRRVAFSPDGMFLATAPRSGSVGSTRIWRTYPWLYTQGGPRQSGVQLGDISPDGKVGAIISGDAVQLWDTEKVTALGERLRHEEPVKVVAFSPDGKLLATASWLPDSEEQRFIRLWSVATGQTLGPSIETSDVIALAFSSDGKLLADGRMDWRAGVFQVATGRCLQSLLCDDWVFAVAFSPDGKVLATGSGDGKVRLWDVTTGQQIASPLRCRAKVSAIAYSPDGYLLATASDDTDQTVQLWDVSANPPYCGLTLPPLAVSGKAALRYFSSDGTVLIRRLAEGKARVWHLPSAPTDLREIQIQTWIVLGARRNQQGEITTIGEADWQKLHQRLRAFETPSKRATWPQPDNRANGVKLDLKIAWVPGLDAVEHHVYFGTSPENMVLLGKVQDYSYDKLPPLEKRQFYCWRVDEVNSDGAVVKGNLWSFSTGDMVGWWKFDGDTDDSSGYENAGTFVGDPEWVAGYDGSALKLDGIDDYVETGYTTDLPNWTISVWVTSPAPPSSGRPSGPVHRERNYQLNWNHVDAAFRGAAALEVGGTWYAASFGTLKGGTWYQLAATYDGAVLKAFKNGALITSNPSPSGNPTTEGVALKIGRHSLEAEYFRGTIDDVRIYSYALSEAEVAAIYAGKGPGPIAKPKWFVDVSGEEYAPPESEIEKTDEYYVPLGLELERQRAEQILIKRQEALEIKRHVLGEEHVDTLYSMVSLAWLQATSPAAEVRDGAKAVELATKACELMDWKNAWFVNTLAAAYAEAGDFDSAVKWQKEAIDLLTEEQPSWWRAEFQSRLKLYESGKPYRESPSENR